MAFGVRGFRLDTEKVQRAMREAKVDMFDMAEAANTTRPYMRDMMRGKRSCSLERLEDLCKLLRVEKDDLLVDSYKQQVQKQERTRENMSKAAKEAWKRKKCKTCGSLLRYKTHKFDHGLD